MKYNVSDNTAIAATISPKNLGCTSQCDLREGQKPSLPFFISPPQQLAFDCVRDNTTRELRLICVLKAIADRNGRVPLKGVIERLQAITGDKQARTISKRMNRLIKWGWIGKGNFSFYIKSWDEIKELTGHRSRKRTRLDVTKDFLTQIFTKAIGPMYDYQEFRFTQVKTNPRKRQKKYRAVPDQKHKGGIALSLIALFFEKSKVWALKMKRKCKDLRLLDFEARFLIHDEKSPIDALSGVYGPGYFVVGNTVFERISDVITVCNNVNYNKTN